MIEFVAELPPIIVSDLLGIASSTAQRWARFTQDSWADYLAACRSGTRVPWACFSLRIALTITGARVWHARSGIAAGEGR